MRAIIAFAAAVEILAVTTVGVNIARSYGIAGAQAAAGRAQVSQSIEFSGRANLSGVRWIGG